MSSQNRDELQRKVEEVKQDADVQRALQQATLTEKTEARAGRARARDKVWLGTQLFLLIVLGALYQFIRYRLPQFAYPLVLKLILAIGVVVVCFTVLRFIDVYLIGRVRNAVYQYNLKRVSRLVVWIVIAFFVLTIFFQNWYTAVVSFGLISLILEAIVRYLVHPKEAGRVKTRLIKELLDRLNAEPDRVMFPRDSAR